MTSKTLTARLSPLSLSHYAYHADTIRQVEPVAAKQSGCSMYDLMRRAGQAAYDELTKRIDKSARVLVLVGTGNNGGDGYVLAKLLKSNQYSVTLASIDPNKSLSGDAKTAREEWLQQGGQIRDASSLTFANYDVIVDALLGTGLVGEVRDNYKSCIEKINHVDLKVMSLDIPSGLHADSGIVLGSAVQADFTVTFVAYKTGLLTGVGRHMVGELILAPLAIEDAFQANAISAVAHIGHQDFLPLKKRESHSHKGNFGRLLCIGGNAGMSGAIRLSAEAAMRTGAGLVKVYCHQNSIAQVSIGRPELMVSCDNLAQQLYWADCIAFGPGLGREGWSKETFSQVFSYLAHENKPIVIDADGINLLSEHLHKFNLSNVVVTPHPAEAARMLNTDTQQIESERYAAAQKLNQTYNAEVVLKGAGTIVCSGKKLFVCKNGNPGMATAGMGDALSGVIGSLLAQGMASDIATLYGVCLHSAAADKVAKKQGQRGMLASDIFPALQKLIN